VYIYNIELNSLAATVNNLGSGVEKESTWYLVIAYKALPLSSVADYITRWSFMLGINTNYGLEANDTDREKDRLVLCWITSPRSKNI